MSDTMADSLKSLTIRIPEKLHRALKVKAAQEGRSMVDIVEAVLKQYLREKSS